MRPSPTASPGDLCAMRTYWGSIILNKYPFGGEFPSPTSTSDADLFPRQVVPGGVEAGARHADLLHRRLGRPLQRDDLRAPGLRHQPGAGGRRVLEKTTGRKFNDELFIEAVKNEMRSTSLWAAICCENKACRRRSTRRPCTRSTCWRRCRSRRRCADFYQECPDEVKDPSSRGIAAVPNERCCVMSDTQPPWASSRCSATSRSSAPSPSARSTPSAWKASGKPSRTAAGGRAPCRGRRASR